MAEHHEHITAEDTRLALAELEPDQLVAEKSAPVPRRRLGPGALVLLWALRIYLLFMLAVVFWQAWIAVR
ncbi:MAG TPA: hypothetical protein VHX37_10565 [Acidobacteriaceae bacterium]|jgi:hypothetical protein|nr:hypothetical protein [Acidobacteriaceae bacterium]